jgi:hypothetical protein
MKRKVRIYKDPNGQGAYVNKTAQWLSKAQEGAETGVTPVTAGMMQQMQSAQQQPQQMQQQSAQPSQEDMLLQDVTGMISQGIDKEEIKNALLAKYVQFEQGTAEYNDAADQMDTYLETVYDQLGEDARIDTNQQLNQDTEENQQTEEVPTNSPDSNYYNDLAQEDNSQDDANSDLEAEGDEMSYSKYGGTPSKSAFMKKTLKQLKKAQEGQETSEDTGYTANIRGNENTPAKIPGHMSDFIAGIKGQVEENILREDAEKMYNNMYGQDMASEDYDGDQDTMDYAQFGGGAGRRMKRGMRKVFGRGATPPGVTSSKFTYGPLGGVRTADVQYNPLMMLSMYPGLASGAGGFGYGYSGGYGNKTNRQSTGRLVTERVAKTMNKDAVIEVSDATKSDAAKKSADAEVVVSDGTNNSGEASSEPTPVNGSVSSNPVTPKQRSNTVSSGKDNWNRSQDNPYYGMDPATKIDKWGRSPGNKWYGFNPETKQYEHHQPAPKASTPKAAPTNTTWSRPTKSNINNGLSNTDIAIKAAEAFRFIPAGVTNLFGGSDDGEDWNNGYGGDSMEKFGGAIYQVGGATNNLMQDPYGNLQQFVYGGDEVINDSMLQNLYQPPINEQDLNYTDSKDSTDSYFQEGGAKPFTGITTQEDYDKKLAEEKTKWQTEYDKTLADKQRQQKYDPQGYNVQQGTYGQSGINQPVWGAPQGTGRGAFGSLFSPYTRGPRQYSPVGDPLAYAATAAGITKSGMLPTGVKYSREKSDDFLGKIGLKHDKSWTLDYATPAEIQRRTAEAAKTGQPTTPVVNTPGTTPKPGTNATPGRDRSINNWMTNAADRRAGRQEDRGVRKFGEGNGFDINDGGLPPEEPRKEYTPEQMGTDPRTYDDLMRDKRAGKLQEGGYIPNDYYAYGGYLPEADNGLNMSPVTYQGNPVIGTADSPTWDAMSQFNNQNFQNANKDLQNPNVAQNYSKEPDDLKDCTDEQKADSTSACYDPQTAQLKIKAEKSGTVNYDNIARGYNAAATGIGDAKDYYDERRTKFIPGMTDFAYGEKQSANEVVNRGEFDARTGREGISGFEGVIKKGGSIGHKKGGEYSLTMQEIHDLIRDGGLVEFLD